jgi:hypothetical protein
VLLSNLTLNVQLPDEKSPLRVESVLHPNLSEDNVLKSPEVELFVPGSALNKVSTAALPTLIIVDKSSE